MTKEKFNLSEKEDIVDMTYDRDHVKEFIRLLKKEFRNENNFLTCYEDIDKIIDTLSGDKLI
jgi:hypothetical protein